jgi:hypothetical protein
MNSFKRACSTSIPNLQAAASTICSHSNTTKNDMQVIQLDSMLHLCIALCMYGNGSPNAPQPDQLTSDRLATSSGFVPGFSPAAMSMSPLHPASGKKAMLLAHSDAVLL